MNIKHHFQQEIILKISNNLPTFNNNYRNNINSLKIAIITVIIVTVTKIISNIIIISNNKIFKKLSFQKLKKFQNFTLKNQNSLTTTILIIICLRLNKPSNLQDKMVKKNLVTKF